MLEILFCSIFTIVPDYLYRHYREGKRMGREITLFSVWYELRWGITGCIILTLLLITIVFYNHPSTTAAASFFRTIPILPETGGRVTEIYVGLSDRVEKGAPIFKLDSSEQEAALEVAKRRVSEIDAQMVVARSDIAAAIGQIDQAKSGLQQAEDELNTKLALQARSPGLVAAREIEKLQVAADGSKGQVAAAEAAKEAAETRLSTLLPAQKASAEAQLDAARFALEKMTVYAGVTGRVEQFVLRVGDVVSPIMRPAGILIPEEAGRRSIQAGFNQIEAQVMKPGMVAEAVCLSKPLTIIPLVVTGVQDYIAAGQVRAGEQLLDAQFVQRPGTLLVFLEPLYSGGLEGVPPGSSCIVNAYSNNHDRLANEDLGAGTWIYLHVVDTVALVHAALLRSQALLLPIKTLVLFDH